MDQTQLALSRRVIHADLEIARPLRLFDEWHNFRGEIGGPEQYSLPGVKGRFGPSVEFLAGFLKSGLGLHAAFGGSHFLYARKPAEHQRGLRVRCHNGSEDAERAGVFCPQRRL